MGRRPEPISQTTELGVFVSDENVGLVLDNLGRGPALDVSLFTDVTKRPDDRASLIDAGQSAWFIVPRGKGVEVPDHGHYEVFGLVIVYRDISGGKCTTRPHG
jgi:hypothetical protein